MLPFCPCPWPNGRRRRRRSCRQGPLPVPDPEAVGHHFAVGAAGKVCVGEGVDGGDDVIIAAFTTAYTDVDVEVDFTARRGTVVFVSADAVEGDGFGGFVAAVAADDGAGGVDGCGIGGGSGCGVGGGGEV